MKNKTTLLFVVCCSCWTEWMLAATIQTDQQITKALQQTLQRDVTLKDADVVVSVKSGQVTLKGQVYQAMDRYHIERTARRILGVRGVVNLIQVASSLRNDREIADDILRRFR